MQADPDGAVIEADFIVVGSGAGGGPLAANLARAGFHVVLLEAGGDEAPPEYDVPAFYTRSTEHPDLSWEYFVRHYRDSATQARDTKHVVRDGGPCVFYPRAGTLGGCTAHHAMITVYPHGADWDRIAELTGDPSWCGTAMEAYFTRLERCRFVHHRARRGAPRSRHGYDGWLPTGMADLRFLLFDTMILRIALSGFRATGGLLRTLWRIARQWGRFGGNPWQLLLRYLDPNDEPLAADREGGLYYVPISVDGARRAGARERVLETAAACPDHLTVVKHALATRVLFEGDRAVGVAYLAGRHLYQADPRAGTSAADPGTPRIVRARREVILAAGAFNTPQLLMLSGIGPKEELEALGIEVIADRPGVGANLQDRCEVALVYETKRDFSLTRGAVFRAPGPGEKPDRLYAKWLKGKGPYGTNGGIVALVHESSAARFGPDVISISVPGLFRGYFPGYSGAIAKERNYFSWVILKAHTRGTSGRVRLRSADPTVRPEIDFNYFETPEEEADLDAVADAIARARKVALRTWGLIRREVFPGPAYRTHADLRRWVYDESWGHHASCTARIGRAGDPMAVVDGDFRVQGVSGLRVVDASVFPWIPGFFIVTAVYMIAEKASDVILAAAGCGTVSGPVATSAPPSPPSTATA